MLLISWMQPQMLMGHQNLESVNDAVMTSQSRRLELEFSPGVPNSPVFTGDNIKGGEAGNEDIQLTLVKYSPDRQVVSTGPEASAKVKTVLVREDFFSSRVKTDDWTPLEFENSIVTELENKKNLLQKKKNILQGDVDLNLNQGRAVIGNIRIKHDKDHLNKRKLRLGAMVVDRFDGVRIKEAITDSFLIMDSRNKRGKNRHRLSLTDKVCQLKRIGKSGSRRKRLEGKNIKNVEDFLAMLDSNPQALKEIYGSKGGDWDITVSHAKTCILNSMDENAYRSVEQPSQEWNDVYHVDFGQANGSNNNLNVSSYHPYTNEGSSSQVDLITNDINPWVHDIGDDAQFHIPYESRAVLEGLDEDIGCFDPCLLVDPQAAGNGGCFFHHSAVERAHSAQPRWKIVSSVVKWFSLFSKIRQREIQIQREILLENMYFD